MSLASKFLSVQNMHQLLMTKINASKFSERYIDKPQMMCIEIGQNKDQWLTYDRHPYKLCIGCQQRGIGATSLTML
jgi:hypothetical protein